MVKVLVEVLIDDITALCGLDENETQRASVYRGIAQFCPVDAILIMTDVNPSHLITVGGDGISVDGVPAEREGVRKVTDKDEDINGHGGHDGSNNDPRWQPAEQGRRLPAAFVAASGTTAFPTLMRN